MKTQFIKVAQLQKIFLFCLIITGNSLTCGGQVIIATAADSAKIIFPRESKSEDLLFPFLKNLALDRKRLITLSISGQFREKYQYYKNEKWGDVPPGFIDNNGFFWHRFMLSSNLQFGKRINVFAELKSGLTSSRAGGERPRIDYNELDFQQLYLQVIALQNPKSNLKIKIGRQEYFFGAQRLFTERNGPNNKGTFNGATVIYQKKDYKLTAFIAQPVYDNFYMFDDAAVKSQTTWGANLTHLQKGKSNKWELYYYGYHNSNLKLAGNIGKDNRHTFGLFLIKEKKGWELEAEPNVQFGVFNRKPIFAYSFYGNLKKKIPVNQIELIPSVGFADFRGNQNSNGGTINTYNPMYPRPAYGLMIPLAPMNLLVCNPEFVLSLNNKLEFSADEIIFWRQSHADGLYTPFIQQIYPRDPESKTLSKFIGINYTGGIHYKITNYLSLGFLGGYFIAGDYIKETGKGKNITYFSSALNLKF